MKANLLQKYYIIPYGPKPLINVMESGTKLKNISTSDHNLSPQLSFCQ